MKFTLHIQTCDIREAITEAVEGDIASVDGVGADGETEYEIIVTGTNEKDDSVLVHFEAERIQGKFASRDEVVDNVLDQVAELVVEVSLTAEEA